MQVPFVVLQVVPWKQNRWPHTSPGAVHMNVYVCVYVCLCVCVCMHTMYRGRNDSVDGRKALRLILYRFTLRLDIPFSHCSPLNPIVQWHRPL